MIRRLHRAMRDRFDTLVSRWMKKRQGVDTDPLELRRSRIYILPTRLGLAYAAMVFAMVIGAMNYNNNVGLALGFLLAGLGLVTMHHCHGNLVGLRLKLLATEPAFAGQHVGFNLLLENRSVSMRSQIELDADGEAPVIVDVPAMGATRVKLARAATRRGRIELERFKAATRHPLGLFRAWAVVYPEYSAVAWPRPAAPGRVPPGVATDTGGAQDHAHGDEDFAGLKPYEPGDGLSKIAWKTYARGQGLHTKQYAGTDVVSHIFDWDSLTGMDTEARLSQLCRWVLDACRDGEACGLRLPGTRIEPNVGNHHRQYCLTSLALFERPDRNG